MSFYRRDPVILLCLRVNAGEDRMLCRLAMDGSDEECLRYAEDLKKSLVRNSSFREEFAEYAAESLAFALGLRTSVQEPSDHGFDAVRRKDEPERADESGRSRLSAEAGVQDAPQHTEKGRASPESAGKAPAAWPGASGNSCSQRRSLNGSARSAQPRDDPCPRHSACAGKPRSRAMPRPSASSDLCTTQGRAC